MRPPTATPAASPLKVEIRRNNEEFRLYRDGRPYHIKGVVYWGNPTGKLPLKDIAAHGGNSVRAGDDRRLLDKAQRLGMTVTVNLPMKMESVHKYNGRSCPKWPVPDMRAWANVVPSPCRA